MGNCFSSGQNQQHGQTHGGPASYAAAVAQSAAQAVTSYVQQGSQSPTGVHSTAAAHQTHPPGLQVITGAYVFKMPDGDTFTCDYTNASGQKATARVRIMGIDCPESNQNFG